jgi:hypothetical protein
MSILGVDSPGPQRYTASEPFRKLSNYKSYGAVKIAEGNPKSDVDWKIYQAAALPSSADYNPNNSDFDCTSGGQFSTAFVPSSLDWVIHRSRQIPGPGDYYPKDRRKNVSFKISEARPKSDVEWRIYRASSIPGPGEYDLNPSGFRPNGARLLGRVTRGNYQTTLPNAVGYVHNTINHKGPNQCREEGAMGRQSNSEKKTGASFFFGSRTRQDRYDYELMCDDEKDWRMKQRKKLARKKHKEVNRKLEELGERSRHFGWDPLAMDGKPSKDMRQSRSTPSIILSEQHKTLVGNRKKPSFIGKKKFAYKTQNRQVNFLSRPRYVKRLPTLSQHAALMRIIEQHGSNDIKQHYGL